MFTAGSQVLKAPLIGDAQVQTEATDEGARVTLDREGGQIYLADGIPLRMVKNRKRRLFEFQGETWKEHALVASPDLFMGVEENFASAERKPKLTATELWHERLGHPGRDKTRKLLQLLKNERDIKLDAETPTNCAGCIQAKSTKARHGAGSGERADAPLDLVHIDLIIDSSRETEFTCTLVAVDDYSKYVYVQPLVSKADAFLELQRMVSFLELQTGRQLKALRSDQGSEWTKAEARIWARDKGILWQMTVSYDSKQNGRVERMNRSLQEKMRALLIQRKLPARFWPYALRTAAFLINLTPNVDDKIPYAQIFSKTPTRFIRLLRVFGCLAWVNIPKAKRNRQKIDERSVPAIFIGYSLERKGWLFYSPNYSPNIFWSNSAKFMEVQSWAERTAWRPIDISPPHAPTHEEDVPDFGYTEIDQFDETANAPIDDFVDIDAIPDDADGMLPPPETTQEAAPVSSDGAQASREVTPVSSVGATDGTDTRDVLQPAGPSVDLPFRDNEAILSEKYAAIQNSKNEWGHMINFFAPQLTESIQDGFPERPTDAQPDDADPETWPRHLRRAPLSVNLRTGHALAITTSPAVNLSPTLNQAKRGEDWPLWQEAMRSEIGGLEANDTWIVADLPPGQNLVDSKWVLKIKTDANRVPTRYKARLVARGFTQREGVDFDEIFAPVAPLEAIRGILAVATVFDWEVDGIDVVQAYLNSTLHHDVYMKPPAGVNVPPGQVLRLVKGLYGLKQSGREWNLVLDAHLRKIGFHAVPSAPCFYSRGEGGSRTILTCYVDDILITSPSRAEVDRTKAEIAEKWNIEDNGPVKEFLGIKIDRDRKNRHLSLDQSAYIKEMANNWLANDVRKTAKSPFAKYFEVGPDMACDAKQAKKYQELVGQLLWISNTVRPDVAFAVGTLARYMSDPIEPAWLAALQVVRYLNFTADYRLILGPYRNMEQPMVTHTDANWASDRNTQRRSTSGSMTFHLWMPSQLEIPRPKMRRLVGSRSRARSCLRSSKREHVLCPPTSGLGLW